MAAPSLRDRYAREMELSAQLRRLRPDDPKRPELEARLAALRATPEQTTERRNPA